MISNMNDCENKRIEWISTRRFIPKNNFIREKSRNTNNPKLSISVAFSSPLSIWSQNTVSGVAVRFEIFDRHFNVGMNKGCQSQIIIQHHKQSVQPLKNLTRDQRKVQFLEAISYQRFSDRDPVTGFLSSVQFVYTISSPLFTSKYSPDIEVSLKLMVQKKSFFKSTNWPNSKKYFFSYFWM